MLDYKIINIVASTQIGHKLDLTILRDELPNIEYSPKRYYAAIYRCRKPKVSVLVNSSGKLIFTGAKSIEFLRIVRDNFFGDLIQLGYSPQPEEILIQNIVLMINFHSPVNIENVYLAHLDLQLEYEIEVFPGLIIKNENPKFTVLVFKTGKIILTGLKRVKDIPTCLKIIYNILTKTANNS